jgi:hypothetical protein
MERQPVKSSQIVSIGHDPATRELHIEFNSGGVYRYEDVSVEEHQALIAAESIGKHFGKFIRPHKKCVKLPAEKPVEKSADAPAEVNS